jgi:hypothetical protein
VIGLGVGLATVSVVVGVAGEVTTAGDEGLGVAVGGSIFTTSVTKAM